MTRISNIWQILGMFLFSIIFGVVLRIIDSVGSRIPSHFVTAAVSMPAIAVTQPALFTSMLTHGLIPAVFVLWIFSGIIAKQSQGEENRLMVKPQT